MQKSCSNDHFWYFLYLLSEFYTKHFVFLSLQKHVYYYMQLD